MRRRILHLGIYLKRTYRMFGFEVVMSVIIFQISNTEIWRFLDWKIRMPTYYSASSTLVANTVIFFASNPGRAINLVTLIEIREESATERKIILHVVLEKNINSKCYYSIKVRTHIPSDGNRTMI